MMGDAWSPQDHDGWQDAPRLEGESTRVDRLIDAAILSDEQDRLDGMGPSEQTDLAIREAATELARAIRTEARSAYRRGVPDKHSDNL